MTESTTNHVPEQSRIDGEVNESPATTVSTSDAAPLSHNVERSNPDQSSASTSSTTAVPPQEVTTTRFAEVTDSQLQEMATPFPPKSTSTNINWAYNLFVEWRKEFLKQPSNQNGVSKRLIFDLLSDNKRDVADYTISELNAILPAFVIALRKRDGGEYKGDVIKNIVRSLQRHINSFGRQIDIFKDDVFKALKTTIDRTIQSNCSEDTVSQRRPVIREQMGYAEPVRENLGPEPRNNGEPNPDAGQAGPVTYVEAQSVVIHQNYKP